MKTIFRNSLLIGIVLMSFTLNTSAQKKNKSEVKVGVTARLADQLKVSKVSDVDFGGIFIPVDGQSTTATMTAKGIVTAPNTTLYSEELRHAGQLRIDTNLSTKFDILYKQTINLVKDGSTAPLVYTPLLYTEDGKTILFEGEDNLKVTDAQLKDGFFVNVAGKLDIPGNAIAGTYTGTLDVTVMWE